MGKKEREGGRGNPNAESVNTDKKCLCDQEKREGVCQGTR